MKKDRKKLFGKIALFCLIMAVVGMNRQNLTEIIAAEQVDEVSGSSDSSDTDGYVAVEDDDPEAWRLLLSTSDTTDLESSASVQLSIASRASSSSSESSVAAYGIDVSRYQGDIDWEAVKEAGVTFAFVRVGYRGYSGGTIVEDPYAIANIEGALAAGIKVGVYFFSTALDEAEAIEEAQFVLSIIDDYDITYPVVYDCEGYDNSSYRNYGLSSEVRTKNAIAYLNYVEAAGYQGMMYGSANSLKNDNSWETSVLEKYYEIWVAQYYYYSSTKLYPSFSKIISSGKTTSYTGEYRFWQFSSQGNVDGISGYVDLDLEYEYSEESDSTETESGWVTDDDGNTYYYKNGEKLTGLCTIDSKKYYFTEKGVMWTGWLTMLNSSGKNVIYYFGEDGSAQTGWQTIDGSKYYFATSGKLQTGWQTLDGSTYYFRKTASDTERIGTMLTGLRSISGVKYYFSTSGKLQTGWKTISGSRYYFRKTASDTERIGAALTGLRSISGVKYYFSTNGKLQTGWKTISGSTYYFRKTASDTERVGTALTGLRSISGVKYYFSTSGKLQTGWKTISGSTYYFRKTASDTERIGTALTGLRSISGVKYYFSTSGKLQTGWKTINGNRYYFRKTASDTERIGTALTGLRSIKGVKYYFGSDGKLKTGWQTVNGKTYYFDPETGAMT